jgi:hypothetical protein
MQQLQPRSREETIQIVLMEGSIFIMQKQDD